ncbi:serine hydrolase [Aerococcaceae bacterium WGS1372]
MQCPNCGRNVRSKNQCAYCGHVFNKEEVSKAKKDDVVVNSNNDVNETSSFPDARHVEYQEERPSRRSGGGFGKVLWGIIKLILVVALVFLAFLFGPRLINNVVNYFQSSDTEVIENQPESRPEEDNLNTAESDSEDSATESTVDDLTEDTEESESTEEAETSDELVVSNQSVNLDEYPMVKVVLEFDQPLNEVTSETFDFTVSTNGETVDLGDDYSLIKEGQSLSISYNDPVVSVLTTEALEQKLMVTSKDLGINEEITYELPGSSLDSEQADFFDATINDNLSSIADVSAVVAPADADIPFVYDNQSVDADALIAWFVLGHTYNAINAGEITAEDTVEVAANLQAENENSTVSNAEEGEVFTINELMVEVVHNGDASAMNHLIQATGGPNAFNLWLNESNYFATKVTQLLSVQEDGTLVGAVTSAQDIAQFLEKLANNSLISEELDNEFKELLLDSPVTNKYPPQNIEGYQSRYEIANSDTNAAKQYYSGIIELEDTYYIAVVLASNFESAEEVVPAVADSIRGLVTYFDTGETISESEEEPASSEEVVESSQEQVSIIEEPQVDQGSANEDGRNYSNQYVENIGSYVNLPEETIYDESLGDYRPAKWFYNEETGTYQYR